MTKRIDPNWDSSVVVNGAYLLPGDEVPDGVELGDHVPTVTTRQRDDEDTVRVDGAPPARIPTNGVGDAPGYEQPSVVAQQPAGPAGASEDAPGSQSGATGTDTTEGGVQFDPAQHNVPEVVAYLQSADATERQRVLDAEASESGRKRQGVLTSQQS